MRRLTSMDRSALWLTFPPRYENSFVWLYTWPVVSTLNMAVDSGIPFARKHTISVLASDTVRPNVAHTTTSTPIIFLNCSGDCETTPASSAQSMPQGGVARADSPTVASPRPPAPAFFLRCTKASMMPFLFLFFFHLTYSRWTSSLPSCLWSQRIFPSLPGSRLTIFYRDASSALLQLVNQWLNFTYSRSHAFRYERKNTNPTLVRIELTTSVLADVQLTY